MTGLAARAVLRAELRDGRSVLTECVSDGPLVVRRTGPRDGTPTVHVVGGAAGPLGGDHWRIDLHVGSGARLDVRSVAASIALPDRAGRPSLLEIAARVEEGGSLDWHPEPLILAAGAQHTTRLVLDAAADTRIRWREELVCGRHNEASGTGHTMLRATYDGRPLLAHDLAVGPGAPGWDSPAVLGRARAAGTLLLAGAMEFELPAQPDGVRAAVALLAGPGLLVTAIGPDAAVVANLFDEGSNGASRRSATPPLPAG
ncbi:MAG: urease accessory protein UreD [Sporichthyaceae bacterium]